MNHTGDLTITSANLALAETLQSVTGWLYVQAAGARFPALTKTGGLDVQAAGARFPALTKTGGLYVQAAGARFPALQSVTGWLYVQAAGARFPALQSVTGRLDVQAAGARFPALQSVTGRLDVQAAGARFPRLGEVIAFSTWGLFRYHDGRISAGCHQGLTLAQARQHWGPPRTDERARIYCTALAKVKP